MRQVPRDVRDRVQQPVLAGDLLQQRYPLPHRGLLRHAREEQVLTTRRSCCNLLRQCSAAQVWSHCHPAGHDGQDCAVQRHVLSALVQQCQGTGGGQGE